MSHHIYNTEGIVLSSFPIGEADKLFRIFTRELGLVEATAKGIRKIESKNRYGLQDFSVSDISLVRGRDIWRITNINAVENLFTLFKEDQNKLNSLSNIISLVQKLVHGEEKNEELFDLIKESSDFLRRIENLEKKDFRNFELIFYIKILNNLGYFDKNIQKNRLSSFLDKKISKNLLKEMSDASREAEREINNALEETHL